MLERFLKFIDNWLFDYRIKKEFGKEVQFLFHKTEPQGLFNLRLSKFKGEYLTIIIDEDIAMDRLMILIFALQGQYSDRIGFLRVMINFELSLEDDIRLRRIMLASPYNVRKKQCNYLMYLGYDELNMVVKEYVINKGAQHPGILLEIPYKVKYFKGMQPNNTPIGIAKELL